MGISVAIKAVPISIKNVKNDHGQIETITFVGTRKWN